MDLRQITLGEDFEVVLLLPHNRELAQAAAKKFGLVQEWSKEIESTEEPTEEEQPTDSEESSRVSLASLKEDAKSLDRSFVLPGEQATLYALVLAKRFSQLKEARDGLIQACRELEMMLSANDETCRVSAALLCPRQPLASTISAPRRKPTGNDAVKLDRLFRAACGAFYFQIDVPAFSSGSLGASNAKEVSLDLFCRQKTMDVETAISQMAAGMNMSRMVESDAQGLAAILTEAQEIMGHRDINQSISSQTVKLVKNLSKLRCISIRSRSKQVDRKCFIEVCCENIHDRVVVLLKDLTLHTYTALPIAMRVTRVGRWTLPFQLLPGEKHSVCFMLSDVEDISSGKLGTIAKEHLELERDGDLGSRYTSIATVTWSSDVSLTEVRAKHRVEWKFLSGLFDPIYARLRHGVKKALDEQVPVFYRGADIEVELQCSYRGEREFAELYVLLAPFQGDNSDIVIPLDSFIWFGRLSQEDATVTIPIHFRAMEAGFVDLSRYVFLYDKVLDQKISMKEPFHVSIILPPTQKGPSTM